MGCFGTGRDRNRARWPRQRCRFSPRLAKPQERTSTCVIRDGMESETVAIYQTDPTIRMYSEVGKRGPLHAGSSRILLAFAPEAVQTQLLAQRLNRFTPATRIDATWIAADLQRIRSRGYLITSDEVVAGRSWHRRPGPRCDRCGCGRPAYQCPIDADASAASTQFAAAGYGSSGQAFPGAGGSRKAKPRRAAAGRCDAHGMGHERRNADGIPPAYHLSVDVVFRSVSACACRLDPDVRHQTQTAETGTGPGP